MRCASVAKRQLSPCTSAEDRGDSAGRDWESELLLGEAQPEGESGGLEWCITAAFLNYERFVRMGSHSRTRVCLAVLTSPIVLFMHLTMPCLELRAPPPADHLLDARLVHIAARIMLL